MKHMTFEAASVLVGNIETPPAGRKSSFAPRLRRWFRKLRQYGRVEIDLDLRGLLHLGVIFSLAATLWVSPPEALAQQQPVAGLSPQLAAAALITLTAPRIGY